MNNYELQNELQQLCVSIRNDEWQYRESIQSEDLERAEDIIRDHRFCQDYKRRTSHRDGVIIIGVSGLPIAMAQPKPYRFSAPPVLKIEPFLYKEHKKKPFTSRKRFNPKHDRHKG